VKRSSACTTSSAASQRCSASSGALLPPRSGVEALEEAPRKHRGMAKYLSFSPIWRGAIRPQWRLA